MLENWGSEGLLQKAGSHVLLGFGSFVFHFSPSSEEPLQREDPRDASLCQRKHQVKLLKLGEDNRLLKESNEISSRWVKWWEGLISYQQGGDRNVRVVLAKISEI